MMIIRCLTLILCLSFVTAPVLAERSYGIAVTVNDDPISERDISDRTKLVIVSTGMRDTKDNRNKVRPQALESLIEEQIKVQQAELNDLEVTSEETLKGFDALAAQNNMTADQFSTLLKRQGVPKQTLMKQLKADISWRKFVKTVLRPQINITENDINARMQRMKTNIGKKEYQLMEIYLPVSGEQNDKKVKEMAAQLVREMKVKKAPFEAVAAQFSQSATAGQGGMMGWMTVDSLAPKLGDAVSKLQKGGVTSPIREDNGYYILKAHDVRTASDDTMPSQDDMLNSIGLERLDRLQKRTLADLRAEAYIEERG